MALCGKQSVFIGVGRPSTAAILARMVHAPQLVLLYESGTIGAKPYRVPPSIGDGELAQTVDAVVGPGAVQLLDRPRRAAIVGRLTSRISPRSPRPRTIPASG